MGGQHGFEKNETAPMFLLKKSSLVNMWPKMLSFHNNKSHI